MRGLRLTILFLAAVLTLPAPVMGLELVVSGNGADSNSQVEVEQTQTATVTQTNDTSVDNTVETNADTGGNSVNGSGGETSISTGDVSVTQTVTNDVNHSAAAVDDCCGEQGSQVVISGNGADSSNAATVTTNQTVVVNVSQTAVITNTIKGQAVTGNNQVTDAGGKVSISTGDIKGKLSITNAANQTDIDVSCCSSGDVLLKIAGNGEGSINRIGYTTNPQVIIQKTDTAILMNNVWFDAITGGNVVSGALGDVTITTGDIDFDITVANDPINVNAVKVDCCEEEEEPPPPPPPPPPPSNGGGNGNGGNGNGGGGNGNNGGGNGGAGVGGAVLGAMLPATGSRDFLLMLIANLLMFLFGCYLRRYSGRAPAKA